MTLALKNKIQQLKSFYDAHHYSVSKEFLNEILGINNMTWRFLIPAQLRHVCTGECFRAKCKISFIEIYF